MTPIAYVVFGAVALYASLVLWSICSHKLWPRPRARFSSPNYVTVTWDGFTVRGTYWVESGSRWHVDLLGIVDEKGRPPRSRDFIERVVAHAVRGPYRDVYVDGKMIATNRVWSDPNQIVPNQSKDPAA